MNSSRWEFGEDVPDMDLEEIQLQETKTNQPYNF